MLAVLLAACSTPEVAPPPPTPPAPAPAPAPTPAEPVDPEPDEPEPATFEGTVGIIDHPAAGGVGMTTLQQLRATRREGFDRIVFQLEGGLPGYHLEYIDKPVRQCGSGEPVAVAGDAWLEIRLTPAQAHTEAGEPTLKFQERQLDLEVALELQQTCDFEGQVTWVVGVGSPNAFRVLERGNRLLVDIEH